MTPDALVTNPNALGGKQVDFAAFVSLPLTKGCYAEAPYAQPIYPGLTGPRSPEKYHFSLEIGTSF